MAPIKGLFLSSVTLPENLFCENEKIDRIGQNVIEIDSKTMTVKTEGNTYTASKIIVAAGAQTTEIIKEDAIDAIQ